MNMSLNDVVSAERIHIAFFGMRNAGKSSLVNAVTNQNLSVVSDYNHNRSCSQGDGAFTLRTGCDYRYTRI